MAKKTRATGTKTKKGYSGSVRQAASRIMDRAVNAEFPGGKQEFKKNLSGIDPSRAQKAYRKGKAEVSRSLGDSMTTKVVTKVEHNKPTSGRDIPLPKSNY